MAKSGWRNFSLVLLVLAILPAMAQPTVTGFTPGVGPVGTIVTINGTGFSATAANNIVYFGAVRAFVGSATATQLAVTVPVGCTYQPISVTVGGLTAYSKLAFDVTFTTVGNYAFDNHSLNPKIDFATGIAPNYVALGDIDGDGKTDVVVSNLTSNSISVLRNTATAGLVTAGSFAAKIDFTTDNTPLGIALADFDGDGKTDIAVATETGTSVFRNTSTGGAISFAARTDFAADPIAGHDAVAAGDLNKDGKPDLVVTNNTSNTVSVFKNTSTTGAISFVASFPLTTASRPVGACIADIDGNGFPEIISANQTSANLSVFRNISAAGALTAASFSAKVDFTTPTGPIKVTSADFDGDGKLDLAVTNIGSGSSSVFRNTSTSGSISSGSLAAPVNFSPGAYQIGLAVGDIDGDGKPDFGVVARDTYKNTSTPGTISFTLGASFFCGNQPADIAIGDIDGDNLPDLVFVDKVDNMVSVIYNNGPIPVIDQFTPTSGPAGTSVTVYGKDFSPILANNIVYFGTVRATVTAAVSDQLSVTVPSGATYQPISVTVNGRTGYSATPFSYTFTSSQQISTNSFAPANGAQYFYGGAGGITGMVVSDLDLDGKPDIITSNGLDNSISIFKNTATAGSITAASFAARIDIPAGTYTGAVNLTDLDGDGKPDIIVANSNANTISVFRNISTTGVLTSGSFATKVDFATGSFPYRLATGDLDLDGRPDIAVINGNGTSFSLLKNIIRNGTINSSSFVPKVDITTIASHPSFITLADLDQDNVPDIIVSNRDVNTISVFKNTGSGGTITSSSFATSVEFATGPVPESVFVGDIDLDGAADLTVANSQGGTVSVLRNLGSVHTITTGTFATRVDFATGTSSYILPVDLDGDGKLDIACPAFGGTLSLSLLKNVSTLATITSGSFSPKVDFSAYGPHSVAVADIDGDQKPDVLVNNGQGSTNFISVFRNTNVLAAPSANAPASVSQTGFTANWAASPGAVDYRFDLSTDNFATFEQGLQDFTVAGTSIVISGLTSASIHQYRVRAVNTSGTSVNSNTVVATTVPNTPDIGSSTAITNTGFTANWTTVAGATGYSLDVSSDPAFGTFVPGYNARNESTLSEAVTGLSGNTRYYFRVRSVNVSGSSPPSYSGSAITLPDAPINLASNNNTTFIDATWTAVTGLIAVTYQLDISKDNFVSIDQAFTGLTLTSQRISNLTPSTDYKFRVRAINSTGPSANSVPLTARTADVSSAPPLKVEGITAPATVSQGFTQTVVTITLSGGSGVRTVSLKYRPITATDFSSIDNLVDQVTNKYEATITESMFDELGIEVYASASDGTGSVESNAHTYIYRSIAASASAIPFSASFNGSASTYAMFSVPYELTDKNVASVFVNQGGSDKTKWRLLHYQDKKYIEYPDNITSIDIGKGYWFNTIQPTEIRAGAGVVTSANQSHPFSITVDEGWNQIGNPYPFNVSWDAVKTASASAGMNSLWLFEGGNYTKKDVLAKWKGAFVWSDNGGQLTFPVLAKTSQAGRIAGDDFGPTIDKDKWKLPLQLELNGAVQASGIGMSPDGSDSKDRYDEMAVPRFIDYLELTTHHDEYFYPFFSTDLVTSKSEASWLFNASSNQKTGQATMSWDRSSIAAATSSLLLVDLLDGNAVDMKQQDHYSFQWKEGRQFRIVYSRNGELNPGVTMAGTAYPNPFREGITIPLLLDRGQRNIGLEVYDLTGRRIKTIFVKNAGIGLQQIQWDGRKDDGSVAEGGMYIYQVRGDDGLLSLPKRIIKQ